MSWVAVREPYAAPPRVVTPTQGRPFHAEDAELIDAGRGQVSGAAIEGDLDALSRFDEVELESSIVQSLSIGAEPPPLIEAYRSAFQTCDLSGMRIPTLRQCRISDSKLTGTDFSEGRLTDVVFERCLLQLTQLRMARIERVQFIDCTLREVDAFELVAENVSFDGSELDRVNIDRLRANRVDLRGAQVLSFEAMGRLDGCLVSEAQLHGLVYDLAFAAGLGVERPDDP